MRDTTCHGDEQIAKSEGRGNNVGGQESNLCRRDHLLAVVRPPLRDSALFQIKRKVRPHLFLFLFPPKHNVTSQQ